MAKSIKHKVGAILSKFDHIYQNNIIFPKLALILKTIWIGFDLNLKSKMHPS